MYPTMDLEQQLGNSGYLTLGIDEVGRGSLAGPVYVGCVGFSHEFLQSNAHVCKEIGIKDSKLLSQQKREKLDRYIRHYALYVGVGSGSVEYINIHGIVKATAKAIQDAVNDALNNRLNKNPVINIKILIDTLNYNLDTVNNHELIPIMKGDRDVFCIASASIIAKVARDAYMTKLHAESPQYFWEQNKGYATLAHREAIVKYGINDQHRILYVRNILGSAKP